MKNEKPICKCILEVLSTGVSDLESDDFIKLCRRIVVDFLDVLILLKVKNGSLGGCDIISYVHERFNILISSGTVYSCLYHLERDDLIKGKTVRRKRTYTLTQKGKEKAETTLNIKDKISALVTDLFSPAPTP